VFQASIDSMLEEQATAWAEWPRGPRCWELGASGRDDGGHPSPAALGPPISRQRLTSPSALIAAGMSPHWDSLRPRSPAVLLVPRKTNAFVQESRTAAQGDMRSVCERVRLPDGAT
jgi:hypothetical protein